MLVHENRILIDKTIIKKSIGVTIKDKNIVEVQIVRHNAWKGKKAEPIITERIVAEQSTMVDVVTGATNSSNVIMNAVQKAVEKSYLL